MRLCSPVGGHFQIRLGKCFPCMMGESIWKNDGMVREDQTERLWERLSECLSVHHKSFTNCYGSKLGLPRREACHKSPEKRATSGWFYCLRLLSRRKDAGSNFLRLRCPDNHIYVYTVSPGRQQVPHFENLGARRRSVFCFMFQGPTPSTTDFDTHLTGGSQMPFGCGGQKIRFTAAINQIEENNSCAVYLSKAYGQSRS